MESSETRKTKKRGRGIAGRSKRPSTIPASTFPLNVNHELCTETKVTSHIGLALCIIYVHNPPPEQRWGGRSEIRLRASIDGRSERCRPGGRADPGRSREGFQGKDQRREDATGSSSSEFVNALDEGDVLLVTRLDRLARSTRDLLNTLALIADRKAGFRSLGIHGPTPRPRTDG